ncbi:hypothetical protein ABIB25_005666 [Nakamurella sp. UYEF19]
MAALLQNVDDVIFVLGEHLGKSVGRFDGRGHRCGFGLLDIAEAGRIEDVGTEAHFAGGFLGDGESVAGDHLDGHTQGFRGGYGGRGILARRGITQMRADLVVGRQAGISWHFT